MKVSFQYEKGKFFLSQDEKHEVRLKDPLANSEAYYSPTELLLMAMGGCSAADIVTMLPKMRTDYERFRCEVTGERRKEYPQTLTKVNISYIFEGNIDLQKLKRAINLSLTKYCSVSIIVKQGGAALTYSLIVNGDTIEDHKFPEEEQNN